MKKRKEISFDLPKGAIMNAPRTGFFVYNKLSNEEMAKYDVYFEVGIDGIFTNSGPAGNNLYLFETHI